jgi:hypothetical protein
MGTVEPDSLRIRERLNAISPASRAELINALMFPESAAGRIGGYGSAASTARLTELFEDAQRDPALRAMLVGMLREGENR